MFPTTRNLQIRVHVYRPQHYCGDWLTFGCFVPMIADHNLVKKSFGPMIADHDLVKKRQTIMDVEVSTHSWQWLLRNLSVSCRVNQFIFAILMGYTHNLPEKSSNVGSRAYPLHYCTGQQNYLLSNILWFALKICFWADF